MSIEQIELAALLITGASLVWRAARTETKIREAQAQMKKDADGLGGKQRKMIAEQIIEARFSKNFEEIVRRLLG